MARVVDQKTISLRMMAVRMDMGLSQEKFAEMLDVSRNTVADIERAKKSPSLVTLNKLFEKTNITPNQLFYTQEAQTAEARLLRIVSDLEPEEIEKFISFAEFMASGMKAERKQSAET